MRMIRSEVATESQIAGLTPISRSRLSKCLHSDDAKRARDRIANHRPDPNLANFIGLPVVQLQPLYLSIFSCQITDRLLASMKVDSDVYCHRRLLLLTQIVQASV